MRVSRRPRGAVPLLVAAAILLLPVTASASGTAGAAFTTTLDAPQIVPVPDSPVQYYASDSTFPYLPDSQGTTNITFWVDGDDFRSTGQSLDTMGPIDPTTAVLSATGGTFDANGVWLSSAIRDPRDPAGVIYGFYHAEDHAFADGQYGEWNSTGLATSTDDGVTWTKRGQIIGIPKPSTATDGGVEANSFFYDGTNKRWLAIGHGDAFASVDPDAAPGSWKGWHDGAFSTPMPAGTSTPPLDVLPGLTDQIANDNVTWNTYLDRFVMVWQHWGQNNTVMITTSADGVNWDPSQTLLTVDSSQTISYPQINGVSSNQSGQDATLVYEQSPSTTGRAHDMIERTIHFGTTG